MPISDNCHCIDSGGRVSRIVSPLVASKFVHGRPCRRLFHLLIFKFILPISISTLTMNPNELDINAERASAFLERRGLCPGPPPADDRVEAAALLFNLGASANPPRGDDEVQVIEDRAELIDPSGALISLDADDVSEYSPDSVLEDVPLTRRRGPISARSGRSGKPAYP